MADEQNVIKQIVWTEVFSFPHIFKSFKMAIRPSSLLLGMALLVLLFAGGYVLDRIWGTVGGNISPDEMQGYLTVTPDRFEQGLEAWDDEDGRLAAAVELYVRTNNQQDPQGASVWTRYAQAGGIGADVFLERVKERRIETPLKRDDVAAEAKKEKHDFGHYIDKAEDALDTELDDVEACLKDLDEVAEKKIEEIKNDDADLQEKQREAAEDALEDFLVDVQYRITLRKQAFAQAVRDIEGVGVFESFVSFEEEALDNAILSVRYLNFTGCLSQYMRMRQGQAVPTASTDLNSFLPDPITVQDPAEQPGLLYNLLLMADGVRWMIAQHCWFATAFLVWALALWSVLGGAIYRIAAIQFARDEKISAGQALKFAKSKALSFFLAPLVPVAVILIVALLLMVGGAIGSLGSIGAIVMGVLFLIAILLGIAAAFLLIGLVAGLPLMFPTIAAEGSDSFDAISRSVSYVFRRPFRAVFYGVTASVYGMVTYLFVRLFAYIALCSVHTFVKWGMFTGGDRLGENADKMDVLWAAPTFWNLHSFNWAALDGFGETIAAVLVAVWVYLVVAAVAAYLITFFASASTTVYFILRRREDGTDLDDVFVEEEPEEYAEPEAPAEEPKAEEPKADEAPAEPAKETEEPKDEGEAKPE